MGCCMRYMRGVFLSAAHHFACEFMLTFISFDMHAIGNCPRENVLFSTNKILSNSVSAIPQISMCSKFKHDGMIAS